MFTHSEELFYLTLTAGLTGIIWVPYIINRLVEMGAWNALRNPQPDRMPAAQWATRLIYAHRNGLENLAIFAPLIISIEVMGLSSSFTANLSAVYFFSRVVHLLVYAFGIPVLRSIAFFIGFGCQCTLFYLIVMAG